MSSYQQVIIIGHLGQDPEVRQLQSGAAVTNLSVATSESWTDKQTGEKREQTEWHRVTLFERKAEIAGEFLRKGSLVMIVGRLQTRKWQDKEGNDRYTTEIRGDRLVLMPNGKQAEKPAASRRADPEPAEETFDDDIPF